MSFKLRGYQDEGIDACMEILNSKKQCREIVIAPTAAGKSIYLAEAARVLDEPILILQPSKELLLQNYAKFIKVGGKASICCASVKTKTIKGEDYTEVDGKLVKCREITKVTFATVGTVIKYTEELKKLGVKKALVDEAHLMTQSNTQSKGGRTVEKEAQIKKLVKALNIKNLCGVTATALYLKGGAQGASLKIMTRVKWKLFTGIRHVTQISHLVENNYWSKLKYQVNDTDQSVLKNNSSGSDYTVESLKDYYESNNLKEQIIEEVKSLMNQGRKSILVFLPNIADADSLFASFPNSAVVHSKMRDEDRDYVIKAFRELDIPVVFNVNILSVGFDHPELDAIITARPTNSISVYYQQIGRGVRIFDTKEDCKVVDFSGNVKKFGIVEELHYDDIPGYGWGLFNGRGELLTDYPLAAIKRPTKEGLLAQAKEKEEGDKTEKEARKNPVISFGMFKTKKFWDVARSPKDAERFFSYMNWAVAKYDKEGFSSFDYGTGKDVLKEAREYLNEEANNFWKKKENKKPEVKKIKINIPSNLF
tara:strand:+ start:722 stop:2332 length:1611 start_codon:yes stop_codon:yes gene_type:complete